MTYSKLISVAVHFRGLRFECVFHASPAVPHSYRALRCGLHVLEIHVLPESGTVHQHQCLPDFLLLPARIPAVRNLWMIFKVIFDDAVFDNFQCCGSSLKVIWYSGTWTACLAQSWALLGSTPAGDSSLAPMLAGVFLLALARA